MAFSEDIVKHAWHRADGLCENCKKLLSWEMQGKKGAFGWVAHHVRSLEAGGDDSFTNCQILCQTCYKGMKF